MADIFISYKQERRTHAERLAVILAAHGYDVWWDYRLVAGDKFRKTIEEEIDAAKAVIVLWCRSSIESNFVIDEAEHARKHDKLLQACIESVEPPLGFRSVEHRTSLVGWPGNIDHEVIEGLLGPVARLVGQPPRRPRDLIRALAIGLGPLPPASLVPDLPAADFAKQPIEQPTPAQEREHEHTFFKACETAEEFDAYLNRYPEGHFSELAARKVKKLDAAWIEHLDLTPKDWSTLFRDDLLAKPGPRASRAELEPRARRGSAEAMTLLALQSSVAGDDAYAFRLYEQAAELGFPRAMLGLAVLLQEGRGVAKNKKEALKWFREAAQQGNSLAQFLLWRTLNTGKTSAAKKNEAAGWLLAAGESGFTLAQSALMHQYAHGGSAFEKNANESAKWCKLAAENGDMFAQWQLGQMYEEGGILKRDLEQAVHWYRKSAEQGNSTAQFSLATALEYGRGVKKNISEALRLYVAAADYSIPAMLACGRMFEEGIGIAPSKSVALKYYTRAAGYLDPIAQQAVERLTTKDTAQA